MRWLVLFTFLFAGCSGPAATSIQAPVPATVAPKEPAPPAEPDAPEPTAGLPDNRKTQEQRDYRRVLIMEDTHRVYKKVAEGEASRGEKEKAADTRQRLRRIEDEHRELIIQYPQWQRPVLRH